MQKWEYLERTVQRHPVDLDKLGKDGWELVCAYPVSSEAGVGLAGSTTEVVYVFKRPIKDGA